MSTSTATAERPYPLPRLIAFGTVGIPLAGMLLVFGLWAPRYYVTLLTKGGMNGAAALALVGLAFFAVRALDICIDPLVALAMDRTRTPIGRYRPWLILGLP
ncbi:MAG TPA: MFS transporter, partial [Caulobacteraceae bacterium]|nr:MFS transporter [Caulobacteraceae bacterium]